MTAWTQNTQNNTTMKRDNFKAAYRKAISLLPDDKKLYKIELSEKKCFAYSTTDKLIRIKFDLVENPQVTKRDYYVALTCGKIELRFFQSYQGIELTYHKTDMPEFDFESLNK